jgi:hypothetical protein
MSLSTLGPCTTPFFGSPFQFLHEFFTLWRISLRSLFFFSQLFVPQAQVEPFVLIV